VGFGLVHEHRRGRGRGLPFLFRELHFVVEKLSVGFQIGELGQGFLVGVAREQAFGEVPVYGTNIELTRIRHSCRHLRTVMGEVKEQP
jgi:hypothetical protein